MIDLQNPAAEPVPLSGHQGGLRSVAFSPDSRRLAAADSDGILYLWNVPDWSVAPTVLAGHEGYVNSLIFSPDGRWLASGSYDKTVRLWDMKNPGATPVILRDYFLASSLAINIAFSPESHWFAMAGGEVVPARLWDLQDLWLDPLPLYGREERATYAPEGGLVFSPTGRWLATWNGGILRLWDMQNPSAEPILLKGHENDIHSASFSPDEGWIATASLEQTRLWNLDLGALREKACQVVGRNFKREEWTLFFPNQAYRKTCDLWPLEPDAMPTLVPTP